MNLTLIIREIMGGKTYKKILQKGVHSIVLPPTKHFLPIGHALSFEQINSQRWQHGDHRPSSGPTLPVPYIFFPRLHGLILQTSCKNFCSRQDIFVVLMKTSNSFPSLKYTCYFKCDEVI